jgi:hypothetical protein
MNAVTASGKPPEGSRAAAVFSAANNVEETKATAVTRAVTTAVEGRQVVLIICSARFCRSGRPRTQAASGEDRGVGQDFLERRG